MILELDPYESEQLPDIFSATDKLGSLFFFTKLTRKKGTTTTATKDAGTNIDRTLRGKEAGGSWHGDTKNKKVKDGRRRVIGISRKLSYRPAPGTAASSRNRTRYIMTEYLLPSNGTNYDMFKDWVLCRLVKSNRRKDGDEVGDQSAASHSSANSPCEGVESTPTGIPPDQTLANFEVVDSDSLLLANQTEFPAAANSSSAMAADNPHTCEVDQASVINNLQLSTVAEILPLQTLVGFEYGDNQAMAYDSCTCCEAPAMNNVFPLEYSTSTAVEVVPLQTLVDVEHSGDHNQVMDYSSYATEVEATPTVPFNNEGVLSRAVEIARPQSVVNFEDGDEGLCSALMAMDYENQTQLFDWAMEPFVGEEWQACINAFSS